MTPLIGRTSNWPARLAAPPTASWLTWVPGAVPGGHHRAPGGLLPGALEKDRAGPELDGAGVDEVCCQAAGPISGRLEEKPRIGNRQQGRAVAGAKGDIGLKVDGAAVVDDQLARGRAAGQHGPGDLQPGARLHGQFALRRSATREP